ncbi:MAG: ribokinase [Micrococcales bacterium]|nr:ribokinase [Micrococcales bacterium]
MGGIVVLGSANMDLVVRQPRLPEPGETMFGSAFDTVPGGKGLNQAVAAARAGAAVAFVGSVGTDSYGDELLALLRREGIAADAVTRSAQPTGTAHIAVLDGGENAIVVVSGANAEAVLTDAARAAIAEAAFLVTQFERPQPLLLEAARLARAAGATVVLTPAPAAPPVHGLLELVDLLVPNAGEARALAGVDDTTEAAALLSRRAGRVIVTRGAEDALVAEHGAVVGSIASVPAHPVDTTAAGDTFVGVLVARLAAGESLADAGHAAATAAALSVERPGATAAMPSWSEIAARL